jgi:hypothetical protein
MPASRARFVCVIETRDRRPLDQRLGEGGVAGRRRPERRPRWRCSPQWWTDSRDPSSGGDPRRPGPAKLRRWSGGRGRSAACLSPWCRGAPVRRDSRSESGRPQSADQVVPREPAKAAPVVSTGRFSPSRPRHAGRNGALVARLVATSVNRLTH